MARNRLIFFGGEAQDSALYGEVSARLGLDYVIIPSRGLCERWERLPGPLRGRRSYRLAEMFSPWFAALDLAAATRPMDIVLVRNIRAGITFLGSVGGLAGARRNIILTWFTLKGPIPDRWRAFYRRALERSAGAIVYSPVEVENYARWFGVSPERFTLMPLEAPQLLENMDTPAEPDYDVFMGGDTNRDWETYFEVARRRPHLRFAAAGPIGHAAGPTPANLVRMDRMPFDAYCRTILSAKIQAILVRDRGVAVGQRDFLLAGRLRKPVVVTDVEALKIYDPAGTAACFVPEADPNRVGWALDQLVADPAGLAAQAAALGTLVDRNHSVAAVCEAWVQRLAPLAGRTAAGS